MDQKAMYKLTYGLFILTAKQAEKDNGCIVNTVMQVTSTPNRIAIAVSKQNYTHQMIMDTGVFNISVLEENSNFETYKHWGYQSGKNVDKLESIEYSRAGNGVVFISHQCNAYICAKVVSSIDLCTHTLFVADVTDAEVLSHKESVTYSFYQKNIKPSSKAKAAKKGFICVICGYIYEGDTLPNDFVCPICKHPAEDFKPLQ